MDRFWEKVDKGGANGCWIWTAGCVDSGYGSAFADGKHWKAHRLSWHLAHGPIPDGMCVLHHCDVRRCVNPDHLFLGLNEDNVRDRVEKGRSATPRPEAIGGERNSQARLTEVQVRQIWSRYASGESSQEELSREYDVSESAIELIACGRTWQHLGLGRIDGRRVRYERLRRRRSVAVTSVD